jgi:nucleoside-diphosphate-sugar epimerase
VTAASELVLVTGAHGFIGATVVRRLLEEGYRVRVFVRRDDDVPGAERFVGDITDDAALSAATSDVDVVVHCAGSLRGDMAETLRVNVEGTRLLARAARESGCGRFVHLSTAAVFALVGLDVVDDDTPTWPFDADSPFAYGVTKAEAERVLAREAERGLSTVVLRPPSVLGADPLNPLAIELPQMVRDGRVSVAGTGDNTWPYVHVENLVDVILLAMRRSEAVGRSYIVLDGHTTWGDYLRIFAALFGTSIGTRHSDGVLDEFHGRFVSTRLRDELGYEPRRTFDDAVAETRAFLVERGLLPDGNA